MLSDLIIDVGMHRGSDTEFYLKKGFRVVSIEANPNYVEEVQRRLSRYVADCRLRLENVAIAEYAGTIEFWMNEQYDDWGTADPEFIKRNEDLGTPMRRILVPCKPFGEILDEVGTPYYLKVDIEGSDLLCLEALQGRELPKYVSVEAALNDTDCVWTQFSMLWRLGYRYFKIVNQGSNRWVRCPTPPREGRYIDARFDGYCSGLFGEESPGRWRSATDALLTARRLVRDQQYFGVYSAYSQGPLGRSYRRCYRAARWLLRRPIAWYDIHAKLGT